MVNFLEEHDMIHLYSHYVAESRPCIRNTYSHSLITVKFVPFCDDVVSLDG